MQGKPWAAFALVCLITAAPGLAGELRVGFGKTDVTPNVKSDHPVWLAGYGHGRRATGVHDPLYARAVVLRDTAKDGKKVAMLSVDVVGIMRPTVLTIRKALPGFDYVLVCATHNHEGPDTIGLWGATPFQTGIDPDYMKLLVSRCVEAVRDAEKALRPALARYGTVRDEKLIGDSRLPKVKDAVLRVLRFDDPASGEAIGLLVQWNCHPEALGPRNTLVTADFPAATIATLERKYGAPVAYFTGPIGGLMAPPEGVVRDVAGRELHEGDFEYARVYGEMVAALASKAIDNAEPIALSPMRIASRTVNIPLANIYYVLAGRGGVVRRDMYRWTGDPWRRGRPFNPQDAITAEHRPAVETEVALLRLGKLHVACLPGETYPELVTGRIEDPAQPGTDFPDSPLEVSVMSTLRRAAGVKPGAADPPVLLFDLANDEIGYLIPKRQWDQAPPYAYGRSKSQYGEINSVGPEAGPIVMKAIHEVQELLATE